MAWHVGLPRNSIVLCVTWGLHARCVTGQYVTTLYYKLLCTWEIDDLQILRMV